MLVQREITERMMHVKTKVGKVSMTEYVPQAQEMEETELGDCSEFFNMGEKKAW